MKLQRGLKLVSFDVWDTLLSVGAFYQDISSELSKTLEEEPTLLENKLMEGYRKVRALRRAGRFSDSEIVPATLNIMAEFLGVEPETIELAVWSVAEKAEPKQYLLDGVVEVARQLKELGLTVVVVGNVVFWPGKVNRVLLERAGLAKFIDAQFYADEVGVSKPKPEIFMKALSSFNVEPGEALHVGDSLFEDLVGAVLAHLNAVLVDKNVGGVVKLSSWNAYIIPDLRLLVQVVQELEKH
jgi:putative hydrolase of the HAD superfamily